MKGKNTHFRAIFFEAVNFLFAAIIWKLQMRNKLEDTFQD